MATLALGKLLAAILACLVIRLVAQIIYNLFFHPLRKIPGSRLAAASGSYEGYFDLFQSQSGQYIFEMDRQHDVYGPIVRINPREVHIRDEAFREVLYSRARRLDKDPRHADMFSTPLGIFGTIKHDTHRMRRSALNPFFSKASVIRLEPLVQRHVESICETIARLGEEGQVIELRHAMIALAVDIISEYAFGEPVGAAKSSDSWPKWEGMMSGLAEGVPAAKTFPALYGALRMLPKSITGMMSQTLENYLTWMDLIRMEVRKAIETHEREKTRPPTAAPKSSTAQPTIFTEVLSSNLPAAEKSEERLTQDAVGIISAGSETTAGTIATTLFHILHQPDLITQLRAELRTVMPTRHSLANWQQLERLPLLSATIKEGLRISQSVCGRLPIVLDTPLQYTSHTIPPGTPISMSPRHALMDPAIFPAPTVFSPQRWLENPTKRMERAFVPFSQGPRMCIGLNLAYANFFVVLGSLVARFELEVFETVRERDVDLSRDCFVSKPGMGSEGIRVRVRREFGEGW